MEKRKNTVLAVVVKPNEKAVIEALAQREQRSVSRMALLLMREALAQREQQQAA